MRFWPVVAVVPALVAGVAAWGWWTGQQAAQDRAAAAAAAGATAEALFTYDHADRDAWVERLGRVATDQFAAEYEQRFLDEVWPEVEATEAVSTATAATPRLGPRDGDRIDAVVATEVRIDAAAGERSSRTWIEVELVDAGGWRARDVRIITTGALP